MTVDEHLPSTGTITGRYTDRAGNPDANARVDIDYLDDGFATSATTDDNGDFSASVLADSYHVSFIGSRSTFRAAMRPHCAIPSRSTAPAPTRRRRGA